jgi:hypothetical protein
MFYGLAALAVCLVLSVLRRRGPRITVPADSASHEPGLGWREGYLGGTRLKEAAIVKLLAMHIRIVQRRNRQSAKAARYFRAFHAKITAGITNAEFRVRDDIPVGLRVGYLQPAAVIPATIRFSNASGTVKADTEKDLRGAAVSLNPAGERHDLLMTNAAASHARDPRQFIIFAMAMAGSRLLLLPRLIIGLGLFEAIRMLRTVVRQSSRPVESLACETFWSRSAYKCGERALRFTLVPTQSGECLVPKGPEFLGEDLVERLKRGPVVFDYCVQLFVNETVTPIEDGIAEWKESDSPSICIAQLVIPQQDLSSEEGAAMKAAVDAMEFNPWKTTEDFRPLGALNRARDPVYHSSQEFRTGHPASSSSGCPFSSSSDTKVTSMSNPQGTTGTNAGKCPFGGGGGDIPPTPTSGNIGQPGPVLHPENGKWRPKSNRVGISAAKYLWWNWFYAVMEFFNRALAPSPYRKVSWDRWPKVFGLLYLIGKLRYNRSNALTDPYDYATQDNDPPCTPQPDAAKCAIGADGKWVSDDKNGQMGANMTRFSSNQPPRFVRPDVDKISPSARKVAQRLRVRLTDVDGSVIEIPALILNVTAQGWIQFQFHNFGGNTLRDPINQNPWKIQRDPSEGWPGNEAIVDRTTKDPTRCTYDGRPTAINEKVHAWVQGQLYGNNLAEQMRLRTGAGGKLALDENGLLPEDPSRPGVDLTGFNNNYNPHLSFLHWLFSVEHNAICDYYLAFHPDWDDEMLFQMARKVNCAQIARIHTIEWTEDLLQHPTLQLGMHADFYGLLGQRLKCYLMRVSDRHPLVHWLLTPIRNNDIIWGMPGSKWEHHDGPFQVPKQFRLVYRLHEMVLDNNDIVDPNTGELLDRVKLIDFIHHNTRGQVQKFGYDTLGWSFMSKSCGALKLHNFPKTLTQFNRLQDNNLIDLAELDIFREREDGTGSYNDLRRSLGEPPVTSFMELTGGDAALARELEIVYEGDVDKVDAGIGILAEPKPDGFALGFVQFYQFVLNAPRRVKSNRFLSEGYTREEYAEGIDWVEHGGGFKGVVRRHLPGLRDRLEGVKRGFTPWPDTEHFPERLLGESASDTGKAFLADLRTIALAAVAGGLAAWCGLTSVGFVALVLGVVFVGSAVAALTRILARRFLTQCEQKCNTDKRGYMFGTLYQAESRILRASLWGRLGSAAMILAAAGCAVAVVVCWTHPWLAVPFALCALSAVSTWRWSNSFTANMQVLKVALRKRMRAGQTASNYANTHFRMAVDLDEVNRLFLSYAPGREYFTEYDFARMAELERVRKAAGTRCPITRLLGGIPRRIGQIVQYRRNIRRLRLFADMVVEEDRNLVPAVSREMYVKALQGVAQVDLTREMQAPGDPSPVC